MVKNKEITISKDIRDYIIPLNDDELLQLERNLLSEGCRDPLIVWPKKNQLILIDGHNRYKICQKNNLSFKTKEIHFSTLEEAKIWMVNNQLGRRNLTPDQLSYYRGLKYISLKKNRGGYENVKSKGLSEASTSEFIANQFNVSESTVKRDAKFAEGLNLIANSNPQLKAKILAGEVNVKKADVQILTNSSDHVKIVIKNEADLFNKAKLIRDQLVNDIEKKVKSIEHARVEKAQSSLNDLNPVFTTKDDKIRRIKGMIISAINHAIKERDTSSIKELKKLITSLEDLLFD